MKIRDTISVRPAWGSLTYPVTIGTPMSAAGAVANNADAVGIVVGHIDKAPDYAEMPLAIMTGGSCDLSELRYELSGEAMQAMHGITFFGTGGAPEAEPVYEIPEATTEEAGAVLMAANVPKGTRRRRRSSRRSLTR